MLVNVKDSMNDLLNVNRVEVIDEHGRSYTHYNCGVVQYSLQDDGKTLKIFIKNGDHGWQDLKREVV